jgi:hypothetical protein
MSASAVSRNGVRSKNSRKLGAGRLIYPPMFRERKPAGFEHSNGVLNGRKLPADLCGSRPEAKQRRKAIELIAEGSS